MRYRLFVPWVAVSIWCVLLMAAVPGGEVIPFHAIWISFALFYGFEPWPLRPTVAALSLLAVASGGVLVHRAAAGVLPWQETTEIPLMLGLAALVLWHVQRRQQAMTAVTDMAVKDVEAAHRRERLARLTSHEMRTPLTIATGYVDLLLCEEQDPRRKSDLEVVRDELGRLSRAGDRLLRMIRLQDRLERSALDVDVLLAATCSRWAAVVPRTWVVESDGGVLVASAERLRACLDTLIENAVRYTDEHDTVRLLAIRRDDLLFLGVADSGPGLGPQQMHAINTASRRPGEDLATPDPHSRTGLGLGIVHEVVRPRGGRVLAGRAREGGALVGFTLPLGPCTPEADLGLAQASGRLPDRPARTERHEPGPAATPAPEPATCPPRPV